jgi:hypothetical protein
MIFALFAFSSSIKKAIARQTGIPDWDCHE